MGRRQSPGSAGNDNTTRTELGPFWLWYRKERGVWFICWWDDSATDGRGRTCRRSTGIGGGSEHAPPPAAIDALADHYAAWRKPTEQLEPGVAYVEGLMADWLEQHVQKRHADPARAGISIALWQTFFAAERRAGRLTGSPVVKDINRALTQRFVEWRQGQGISNATINRDLAALRSPLRWAWQNEVIAAAPFIPEVPKPPAKDLVYSAEQIARLLEAARRLPERWHVHLFIMIMLSTHARGEAVLELDAESQIKNGLITFNAPGRQQTRKRRSVVPIAPTLAPWLTGLSGKVIRYRAMTARSTWVDPEQPEFVERPCYDLGKAFEACLIEAGICEQVIDEEGKAIWLPPRKKMGETARRPKLKGIGSPNTLRHTCSTEMHTRGVPEAQIDAAAGHDGDGTNKRNYRHLRPDYLKEFIAGVEDFWGEVGKYTQAHLRSHCGPNVVDFTKARAERL